MSKAAIHAQLRPVPTRFGIGVNVGLQVLLAILLFGAVNYLGYRHYWRRDLSVNQDFTLSSATLNYLRKLSKDVSVVVALPRGSMIYEDTQALMDEFRRNGKKRIKVEYVDPTRDIERAEQLKIETGITLAHPGVLVRANERTRLIAEEEILLKRPGADPQHPEIEFRGEDAVLSAMIGLLEGTVRKFYFVTGKGFRDEKASADAIDAFREIGRQQNFDVQPLDVAAANSVPADASGLLMIGFRYDLTEREAQMIRNYWSAKRAAVLVMLDPGAETPRLDGFLAAYGVRPRGDRVLFAESTGTGPQKRFEVQGGFSKETVITKPLADSITTFSGQTESLEARINDAQLAEQSVAVLPLVLAADRFWGESSYLDDLPVVDEKDAGPPVCIAAAIERGAAPDQRVRSDSSRMVVVGNAALLDKQTQLAVNRDFISASLNWMMNRERLIGITPKRKNSFRIQLSQRQHELIFWISALCAPAFVLALGGVIWAARRSA